MRSKVDVVEVLRLLPDDVTLNDVGREGGVRRS